jgi:hypothetical protein
MDPAILVNVLVHGVIPAATAAAGVLAEITKRYATVRKIEPSQPESFSMDTFETSGSSTKMREALGNAVRLPEARFAKSMLKTVATCYWLAHASLTFAQYVVGGVLATSFVQQSLSKESIGFLGLLVVAAKLIQQHYQLDLAYKSASLRSVYLSRVVRSAEDDLFEQTLDAIKPQASAIASIRKQVSEALSLVEEADISGFSPNMAKVRKSK